jgi:Flp pilus assembly pilin Flp
MFISRFMPRPRRRGFASNKEGTAAIEFALIAPVAMVLMIGAIEYSRAVVMSRRFNLITATLGDLIARDDYEDNTTMAGLKNAMETIWYPYKKDTLFLQVIAVRQAMPTATNIAPMANYVYWPFPMPIGSTATGSKTYKKCDLYTGLPAIMLAPGGSTIIVNGEYQYETMLGWKVPGMSSNKMQWKSSSSHSPRNLCTAWGAANCTQNCE